MMRHYEILTILPGTLSETDVPPVIAKIQEMIESENAKNLLIESGGKNRLAYPMKHIRYGYFHIFTFETKPENVAKIEEKIRLSGQTLRALTKNFDPNKRTEGKTIQSFLGIEEEKETKEITPEIKEVISNQVQTPEIPASEEKASKATSKSKKTTEKSEEKTPEVDMKDFDKQLEAILDDKIAGL